MEIQEKDLSREDSLLIITQMIQQAKGNVNSSRFYFLFWGWLVVIASIAHFALDVYTDFNAPYLVWLIGIPGWVISFMYGYKNAKSAKVKTYSGGLIMWTWIAFTLCIITVIFAGQVINYNITAMVILFSAFATFLTGMIIDFKPLKIGGAMFWLFAPIAFYVGPVYSQLVLVPAIVIGYIIPAYMLKKEN